MACTPEMRRTELRLGFLNSVVVGTIYVAATLTTGYAGLDQKIAVPVITFVTNLLSYVSDILLSKMCFEKWDEVGKVVILTFSKADASQKFRWLLRSFGSMMFVRNVVLSLLDALLVGKLSEMSRKALDEEKILSGPKYAWVRNAFVTLAISVLTFNVIMNSLRFSWVYEIEPDISVTTIVAFWLVYMITHS